MIELTYRFHPEHLNLYRKLASDRASGQGNASEDTWGLFFICTVIVAGFLAGADVLFPGLTGQAFAFVEFLAGILSGVAVVLGLMWWRYRRFSRRAVRDGGPTMAVHSLSVSDDGLRTSTRFADGMYRWSAFEDITVHDSVIVLWIEPGAGVLVPRSTFATPVAETVFLDAVRGHMARAAPLSSN